LELDELGFRDIPSIISTTVGIDYIMISNEDVVYVENRSARISMHAQNPINNALEVVSPRTDQQKAEASHTHPATVKSVRG
jgi:hypothetical protein